MIPPADFSRCIRLPKNEKTKKRYPDELLQYLRLIQLNKDQLRGRTLEDLMFEKKQTDVNELMVLDSLVEACKATIAGYPTTVRTDGKRESRQAGRQAVQLVSEFQEVSLLLFPRCFLSSKRELNPSGGQALEIRLWFLLEESSFSF